MGARGVATCLSCTRTGQYSYYPSQICTLHTPLRVPAASAVTLSSPGHVCSRPARHSLHPPPDPLSHMHPPEETWHTHTQSRKGPLLYGALRPMPDCPLQGTRVVVMDDFAWAKKYSHIVPTNVIASPYVTQYGTGSSGATDPMYSNMNTNVYR